VPPSERANRDNLMRHTGDVANTKVPARFVEPMLLRPSPQLPDGGGWSYELKLDGFRAIAFRTAGRVHLRSRNDNDFHRKYPSIVLALAANA
jgi:ATP-dependent DNA ligase